MLSSRKQWHYSIELRTKLSTVLISILLVLRSIIDVMNEIRPTDDFDAILATRLYYAVMCLKRFFPEWGISMQPHHIRNASPLIEAETLQIGIEIPWI